MPRSITTLVVAIPLTLCCLQAGCISPPALKSQPEPPVPSPVQQVHATWENFIFEVPDSVNNGAPLKGVAGRVYLFGADVGFPLRVRGEMTVDLSDATAVANGGVPVMLERWTFDPQTLDRLFKKDMIGGGYTLFLPWSSYKPEIRKVILQAKFTPEKGTPLYTPPATVSLQPPESAPRLTQQTIRPIVKTAEPASPPMKVERVPWSR